MGFKLIGMGHGICFGQCEQFHIILCNPLLPPAKKLGQVNIFRSVCQEFCSPGGLPHCMLGHTPPGTRGSPSRTRGRHPLEQTPQGADTPYQEQTPPGAVHAGRYGQQAGGKHPTGMQSCLSVSSINAKDILILHQNFNNNQVPVSKPLYIVGLPRSGTTFLQWLLSCDKQFRYLTTFGTVYQYL